MHKHGFESSIAWQRAMDLNVAVDEALEGSRNFGFRDQLFRAALSICNNLAEGYEMPTTANQVRYLWVAKGSCNEVLSMLLMAQRRGYFAQERIEHMLGLQDEVGRLIKTYLRNKTGPFGKVPGGIGLLLFWAKVTGLFLAA